MYYSMHTMNIGGLEIVIIDILRLLLASGAIWDKVIIKILYYLISDIV